jgi:hypothetical protein
MAHKLRGATVAEFIPLEQLEKIKAFAMGPQTIGGKVELYDKYSTEYEVVNKYNPKWKNRRCKLGMFINDLFNSQLELPTVGRRQQIGNAIKFGRAYLIDNPDSSIYHAAAMGAAQEYREWMNLVGDLSPEQQMAILKVED